MSKKKKGKFKNKPKKEKRNSERFVLPAETKQIILGVSMILLAVLISLSFFRKAGEAGEIFMRGGNFLIGESIFIIPLILLLGGLAFLKIKGDRSFFYKEKEVFWSIWNFLHAIHKYTPLWQNHEDSSLPRIPPCPERHQQV